MTIMKEIMPPGSAVVSWTLNQDGTFSPLFSVANSVSPLVSAPASVTGSWVEVVAGYYNWVAYGTWDGATAQLQWSPDALSDIDFEGVLLTSNGGWNGIPISAGYVRVEITNAGEGTLISSDLYGVG